jgi:hypothetical protein
MSRRALVTLFILGLALTLGACKKVPVVPPSSMVGHWEGKAEVAVNWCNAKELAVSVTIAANGNVTGKVGDATLTGGHIYPNPGKQPKGVMLQTKYVIEAGLEGPLVAAEKIARAEICIPIEVTKDGQLAGAFLTSGVEIGSKDEKIFSGGLRPLTKSAPR